MVREQLVYLVPLVLAVLIGPISLAASSASKPDPAGLYLLVGAPQVLHNVLTHPKAREIGPYRAPFARMVQTSSDLHSSLVEQGYWLFPATPLAELCGITLDT